MPSHSRIFRNKSLPAVIGLAAVAAVSFTCPFNSFAQSANRTRAINLIKQAATAFQRGDMTQTVRLCRQAIALDATYPRAYNWLGAAQQRRGEKSGACSAFAKAAKLAPRSADATRAARGLRELKCGSTRASSNPTPKPNVSTPVPTTGAATPIPTVTPTPTAAPLDVRLESNWKSTAGITSLAFSSDGAHLAGGLTDGTWRLWNPRKGDLEKLDRGDATEGSAVASGRNTYALGTARGSVFVFNGHDGRLAGRLEARSGSVTGVAFSPNNQFMAVAGMDNALKIFDVRSNAVIETISSESSAIFGVTFSPNGRLMAVGFGANVRVYDTTNWKVSQTLEGDQLPVAAIAWSRDGALLAVASGYNIRIWDAKADKLLRTLTGHNLAVTALAFGPDSILASGSFDNQLRLWNASSGANVGALTFHNSRIRGLAFTPDGKRLASGDQNGTVAIWLMPEN